MVKTMDNIIISPDDQPVLSIEEIVKSLGSIKTSKSNGQDKLHVAGKLLKPCKTSLLYIIHQIFQPTLLQYFQHSYHMENRRDHSGAKEEQT